MRESVIYQDILKKGEVRGEQRGKEGEQVTFEANPRSDRPPSRNRVS